MPAPTSTRNATPTSIPHTLITWYNRHARTLPWRERNCSPWGVLVSEVMLQQTPVQRVMPAWRQWMDRWPQPGALAEAPCAEVLRLWGRLGYPRRALWLQRAAAHIVTTHGGVVPADVPELKALPGIGDYTAAAVAAFAYGRRALVLDTNIRRVFARVFEGTARPHPTLTAKERSLAESLLPAEASRSAEWNIAVMEFGSLICTSRNPQCTACPIQSHCRWYAAGQPAPTTPARTQTWDGTDRQLRGAVMAVLRACPTAIPLSVLYSPVPTDDTALSPNAKELHRLIALAPEPARLERILDSLIADGLAERHPDGLSLPTKDASGGPG